MAPFHGRLYSKIKHSILRSNIHALCLGVKRVVSGFIQAIPGGTKVSMKVDEVGPLGAEGDTAFSRGTVTTFNKDGDIVDQGK